ncbi:hypothetical protein BJY01DRAFT_187895 [Aspergillus pseudoustus]|uniref:Class E vacuolar protein-sorting machinery protein HSE1 n=1 Tax=Aspergillus pseudoustus TaxID=1810923 RepID=A0ABR4KUU8_9EURO
MFRAQQNAFDDAVAKATDENLTSENWEYILDVCDKVAAEDSGAKDAVAALIKRLAHRNANVQLYTLELANALAQNSGLKIHRELASRSFTDALLRLAADRNTHQQVKSKILERMQEWTEMFASNPDFGIMEQAYMKLKTQNPNLQPPSKPGKREITDVDRQKEEEELQMALALSIREKPAAAQEPHTESSSSASAPPNQPQTAPSGPVPSGTSAATVSRVRALYDFQPSEPGELQFRKGDVIAVLESVYKDWWKGSLRGQNGIFPLNYVEKLPDPTVEELQREAQMEADVFGQIKNVEKLLTLLSTRNSDLNVQDNEEITALYHSTLAIRPKLIELIGKYSQKKDEFTQLNEKFIKARRDYESLLEASMSHPAQPQYPRPGQPQYPYPGSGTPAGFPQGPPQSQHDPQRYFSPHPQDNQPNSTYYPPTTQSPGPGHTPPAAQYQQQQQQQQQPSSQQHQGAPDSYQPVHHRPESTYDHPQELGTSIYDSPVERVQYPPGPQGVGQPQYPQQPAQQTPQPEFSSTVYPPDHPHNPASGLNHVNQAQPPYPASPITHPLPPMQQPPPVPSTSNPAPYPSVSPGPGTSYQAYQPSQANHNPASFYQ